MAKKIKVLHVVNGLGFGGAETWLLEIVKSCRGEIQIDFLLTGGVQRELDAEFLKHGCRLHYVTFSGKKIFSFARQLNKIIKEEGYTIIHDHEDFVAGWHYLFLLRRLPKVRICHAHNSMIYVNNYCNSTGRKLFYKTGKILNALLATHITGTSDQLMSELGYDKAIYRRKRIEPLYCGASPDVFRFSEAERIQSRENLGFSGTDKVVIFIGRIGLNREKEINHKNPEFAISIAKKLVEKDRSFKFIFVGEKGPLGEEAESDIQQSGLGKFIFFLGKRKDVNRLLMAADCMLFTSTLEPFGLVLAEAQFSALPIVASDIITPEVIIFPKLISLLNIRNPDENKWIETIRELFRSGFDRNDFSKAHRNEIDHSIFSIGSSFQRLLRNYQ